MSLTEATGAQVVGLYQGRFTIEESFRDIKDLRFGMGLSNMRIAEPDRRDRLLLVSAMACALMTLLGAAGHAPSTWRMSPLWLLGSSSSEEMLLLAGLP